MGSRPEDNGMPETSQCPECGTALSDDAPEGFCPRCSFGGALKAGTGGSLSPDASLGERPEETREADAPLPGAPSSVPSSSLATRHSPLVTSLGDYELLEEIARGGMGVVYRARQRSLNRIVAVKTLLIGPHASPEFVKRFRAEAVAAASLQHPNIVAIHEVGLHEGQHFFVMDYVEGRSLARVISDFGFPISDFKRCAQWMKTIAEAIHYAHERGILHRDLKPSNVLIDTQDQPRVTDFGLAKRMEGDSELTVTGQVLGSPHYMPPEQAAGKRHILSRRSDVYALGAILYHLLTGRPPFVGEGLAETLGQVLNAEPVSPRLLNPGIPRDLETVCLKCLEKEPAQRYPTAQALAEDLGRFLGGEPIRARPVGRAEKAWRWCGRQPIRAGLIAALAGVVVLGAAGVLWQWQRAERNARQEAEQRRHAEEQTRRAEAEESLAHRQAYAADMNLAQTALAEGNRGRALDLLNKYGAIPGHGSEIRSPKSEIGFVTPPSSLTTDLRHWEWRYLWQQCQIQGVSRLAEYGRPVNALTASPDGRHVALQTGNEVAVWDLLVREETVRLGGAASHKALAFSPSGQWLAMGCDRPGGSGVRLCNASNWQEHATLDLPKLPMWIRHLAFSPDSRRIAVLSSSSDDGLVQLWEADSRQVTTTWKASRQRGLHKGVVAFSRDGARLAIGETDGRLRLVDLSTGQEREIAAPMEDQGVTAVAFSADGRLLAAGYGLLDSQIHLWDTATGTEAGQFTGHRSWIAGLALSPDGATLASASADQSVRLWDVAARKELNQLSGHTHEVWTTCFLPDGNSLLSGVKDGELCLWNLAGVTRPSAVATLPGNSSGPAFTPNGRQFATANRNGTVSLWDTATLRESALLTWLGTNNSVVAFSPDGRTLAVGDRAGACRLADLAGQNIVRQMRAHTSAVTVLAFRAEGRRLLSADAERNAMLWDARSSPELVPVRFSERFVGCWDLSPDGRYVAAGCWHGAALILDLAEGSRETRLPGHREGVSSVVFSPDGRFLATASDDGTAALWDVRNGRLLGKLGGRLSAVHSVAFSPDGQRLATGSTGLEAVKLWDLALFQEVLTLSAPLNLCLPIRFSPEGSLLAGTDYASGKTFVWRAPSLAEIEAQAASRAR